MQAVSIVGKSAYLSHIGQRFSENSWISLPMKRARNVRENAARRSAIAALNVGPVSAFAGVRAMRRAAPARAG